MRLEPVAGTSPPRWGRTPRRHPQPRRRRGRRRSGAGRQSKSSGRLNCNGLTKMLTTTASACRRASSHERQVAVVERAHRGHEGDASAGDALRVAPRAHRVGSVEDLHRAHRANADGQRSRYAGIGAGGDGTDDRVRAGGGEARCAGFEHGVQPARCAHVVAGFADGRRRRAATPRSSRPVESPKMVSPSSIECTGRMARAKPSCATEASLLHSALVSAAVVATTPIVVFSGGHGRIHVDAAAPIDRPRSGGAGERRRASTAVRWPGR